MSHYVVTGGAGFIGSAIVRGLLREGAGKVVVIDNLLTGHEANLEEVRGSIDFQRADIRNYEEIAPLIRGAAVVFHEAAIPSVPRSIDDPVPSHEVNIDGTFNVLRAARERRSRAGGLRGLLLGLWRYRGAAQGGDHDAAAANRPTRCRSWSASITATFSRRCTAWRRWRCATSTSTARGRIPSSPYSGVLSLFMKAILERRSPTIFGDGEQSRDFTYVEDVAELNLKAARAPGVSGKSLQRRQRRPDHAERGVGAGAEDGRRRDSGRTTDRRAPAMCAIRRPTLRPPCATWATRRGIPSKKACAGRWSGTGKRRRPSGIERTALGCFDRV